VTDRIDELLGELRAINTRIEDPSATDAERSKLKARKKVIRAQAKKLSLVGRHPASIDLQIASLERRRQEIEALFIKKGWSEKRLGRTIQDPSAYSHNINKELADKYGTELAHIDEQLSVLRQGNTAQDSP
jgi:hypothetical protein